MCRTAAVLFVHDAAKDIGWWIAHHAAVGFSTLLICDDHSTDGTWDVLTNAATFYDIRLTRSDNSLKTRPERQEAFFKAAREQLEFDWTIALASDEYFLPNGQSLIELLQSAGQADIIPVNWCVYGRDEKTDSEGFSPLEAFQKRAPKNFPDHRVVRHLVRSACSPEKLPHPLDHINFAPDWSAARILHYAGSNLHERMLLGDPSITQNACTYFDRNDITDAPDHHIVQSSYRVAASIIHAMLTDLHWRLKRAISPASEHELAELLHDNPPPKTTLPNEPVEFHVLIDTLTGNRLFIDGLTGNLRPLDLTQIDVLQDNPVILAIEGTEGREKNALLFPRYPLPEPAIRVSGSPTLLATIPLRQNTDGLLTSPVTDRPVSLGDHPFRLAPIPSDPDLLQRMSTFHALTKRGNTLISLLSGIDNLPTPDPGALGCAIAYLPAADVQILSRLFPGLVSRTVMPAR